MHKLRQRYFWYLILVSGLGLGAAISGLFVFRTTETPFTLLLLLILAVVAQFSTTSVPISDKAGITYEISGPVALAAVAAFGPAAAAMISAVANFSLWVIKPANRTTWKKSWEQLAFNVGMNSLAMFVAGWAYQEVYQAFASNPLLAATIPWLPAALIYEQSNLWLLIGILRLQHGSEIKPQALWSENTWATLINILIIGLGAGLLAFAVERLDWIGIAIFFLPIFLSAFAFQLYVRQMQSHMANLENIIAERTDELKQVMREKDQFLAVLTHDMKTPLTSIGLYADLMQSHPDMLTKRPQMADTIKRSQEILLGIVNNILDLEKLETAGEIPLERTRLNLSQLVAETADSLVPQAMEKQIDLEIGLLGEIYIDGDRPQLNRVLQNMLSNAIKYTPSYGKVWTTIEQNQETVSVIVTDTGYGIPEEELPYIFDRFRRVAKHEKKAIGTGLGLAITKALVEAHGGTIEVESSEGEGSIFIMTLPLISKN